MTSTGKTIYLLSIKDPTGRSHSFTIVASTKALAESEACRLAGVPDGTETQSSVNSGRVDSEVA